MVIHVNLALLTIVVFGSGAGSASRRYFENLLIEDSLGEAECDAQVQDVASSNIRTMVDATPVLQGRWVSQDCEVRPGPNFILRRINFDENENFTLVTTYYSDSSCALPTHTVVMRGEIKVRGSLWLSFGANEGVVRLRKLSVIPHAENAAKELSEQMHHVCRNLPKFSWKHRQEFLLFDSERNHGNCQAAFTEASQLDLLKTQTRVQNERITKELLMGSIRNRPSTKLLDFFPLFYPPLLRVDVRHDGCTKCHAVARGTEHSPPHLMTKARLPLLLSGEWISQRCEAYALGLSATRRFTFSENEKSWRLQIDFFTDSDCTQHRFHVNLAGVYSRGTLQDRSLAVDGAAEIDLSLLHLQYVGEDKTKANCLPNSDQNSTDCLPFGFNVPSRLLSIVKLEINNEGAPQLYVGHLQTTRRSTWYQAPLSQCSMMALTPLALEALEQRSLSSKTSINFLSNFILLMTILRLA